MEPPARPHVFCERGCATCCSGTCGPLSPVRRRRPRCKHGCVHARSGGTPGPQPPAAYERLKPVARKELRSGEFALPRKGSGKTRPFLARRREVRVFWPFARLGNGARRRRRRRRRGGDTDSQIPGALQVAPRAPAASSLPTHPRPQPRPVTALPLAAPQA